MIVLARILQKNRANRIYISIGKEIHYEELAHVIIEKAHDLLPMSWRPKKANGLCSSLSRNAQEPECQCLRAGEDGRPSSSRESKVPLLSPLFYLVAQWIRWCSPTFCITQSTELNVNLFKKHPLRHIISVLPTTLTSLG